MDGGRFVLEGKGFEVVCSSGSRGIDGFFFREGGKVSVSVYLSVLNPPCQPSSVVTYVFFGIFLIITILTSSRNNQWSFIILCCLFMLLIFATCGNGYKNMRSDFPSILLFSALISVYAAHSCG